MALDKGQKLYLSVPCGHCIDCRESYQNEWRVRVNSEFVDTINSGGYVLFDTLTYSNTFLPRVSDLFDVPKDLDFPCFRSYDIQLFLKRLRNNLKKDGYDPKDKLRYFIVSEYGSDSRFTHRPHYHVFMFVRHNFVPFYHLSKAISHSWSIYNEIDKSFTPIGITDGLPYKSFSYVRIHNTFDVLNDNSRRIASYLSKYVTKDFAYMDLVQKRMCLLNDHFSRFGFTSKDELFPIVKLIRFSVLPFHRQSLNFGVSILNNSDKDELFHFGIKFYKDGLPLYYPIFPNFKRRLFYKYTRDSLGVVHWKKSVLGLKRDIHLLHTQFNWFKCRVQSYNANHDIKLDLNPLDSFNIYRLMSKPCKSIGDAVNVLKSEFLVDVRNGFRNYCCHGFDFVNSKVFSFVDFGLYRKRYFRPKEFNAFEGVRNKDTLIPFDVINDRCIYSNRIEDGLKLLYSYNKRLGSEKMAVARHQERITNKLKHLNLC